MAGQVNCPKCNSDTWDNAEKVATGWRGPLYKCKNKDCDWVAWPPKSTPKHDPATGEIHSKSAGPGKPKAVIPHAHELLNTCWKECFDEIYEHTKGRIDDAAMMSGVNSLFIARSRLITNG